MIHRLLAWPVRRMVLPCAAVVVVTWLFNRYALAIEDRGANLRVLVAQGRSTTRSFTEDGLPVLHSPRIGDYQSPFYVVHFGIQYSRSCATAVRDTAGYHWRPDPTERFWPSSPLPATRERFRAAADWVVTHLEAGPGGNAHLFYHFDWPYPRYPTGGLRAPWWSGLADAHAITLLLRAKDCFGDERYFTAARALYRSVIAPIAEGGSLGRLGGRPWVEEYVDSRVGPDEMSRVFNGMAYAYFGVRAFEAHVGEGQVAESLSESIAANVGRFDRGYWSDYDLLQTAANIKYHSVNLALLEDPRLYRASFDPLIERWRVGRRWAVPFYLLNGPRAIARLQFGLTYAGAVLVVVLLALRVGPHPGSPGPRNEP